MGLWLFQALRNFPARLEGFTGKPALLSQASWMEKPQGLSSQAWKAGQPPKCKAGPLLLGACPSSWGTAAARGPGPPHAAPAPPLRGASQPRAAPSPAPDRRHRVEAHGHQLPVPSKAQSCGTWLRPSAPFFFFFSCISHVTQFHILTGSATTTATSSPMSGNGKTATAVAKGKALTCSWNKKGARLSLHFS